MGEPTDPGELRGWELGDGDADPRPGCASTPDQAPFATSPARRRRPTQDDGSVVATLAVRNTEAFRSFVISFLEHAEVLDPPELRDDLVAWLEAQT